MKKLAAIVLVLVLCLSAFAGCANNNTTAVDSLSTAPKEDKKLKVVLLIGGYTGDKAFFDSANRGLQMIESELGAETKLIEMGEDITKWEPNFEDVSEQDWDIIMTGTWAVKELIEKIAPLYPEKKYILFDCDVDFANYALDNVYAITYKQNEAAFLSGVLAVEVTKSDMPNADSSNDLIGFVGGMDIPVINDFLVGYVQGAQYANPNIKILTSYIGNFVDAPKCKELAMQQYNQKVDILFTPTSSATLGSLDAASVSNRYIIGVDSDQAMLVKDTDPQKANLILTSALKNVDNTLLRAAKLYSEGKLVWGAAENLGIKEGAVGLAKNEIYMSVPEDIRNVVEEAEQKILSGDIKINTAFGMDSNQLNDLRNSVKP